MRDAAEFREVQRFRQKWLWALMVGVLVAEVGALVAVVRAGADAAIPGVVFGGLVALGVLALLWFARMETEVRDDALYVRFFPFHRAPRRYAWADIARCEARTYRPLAEYGGWGLRMGAYNVSGDRGAQLRFRDGEALLIGSQRADELAAAINRHLV
jgi:hypothetical protein